MSKGSRRNSACTRRMANGSRLSPDSVPPNVMETAEAIACSPSRSGAEAGPNTDTSCPRARNARACARMCDATPPGRARSYGANTAMRNGETVLYGCDDGPALAPWYPGSLGSRRCFRRHRHQPSLRDARVLLRHARHPRVQCERPWRAVADRVVADHHGLDQVRGV